MAADKIFYNGKVLTGEGTEGYIICEAVAVEGDKILATGSNEEICVLADAKTEMIDCKGNSVLPGLCDAHCHGGKAGGYFFSCHLNGTELAGNPDQIVAEIQKRLREYMAENPDLEIIRADGFNQFYFTPDRRPSRKDLDAVCADKPIVMESFCRHALWVNTKAMEMAGITADTPQPESGSFEVEADGTPSGVFHEMVGIALLAGNLDCYQYSVEEAKKIILRYQEECILPYGITLTQECLMDETTIKAYHELIAEGKLKMRVRAVYNIDHADQDFEIEHAVANREKDRCGDMFAIDTVKYFLEGMFVFEQPYEKDFTEENGVSEDYVGEYMWSDEVATASFIKALEHDFQIHVHAMGDGSVHQAVRCLAEAQKKTGKSPRNVVAHVMMISPEYKKMMGDNHMLASLQPRWMVHDNDVKSYYPMMGKERAERVYPDRSLSDAGVVVAYGTDFPVTPPPNPFHGMQCAVTREVFLDAPDYEPNKGMILGPNGDGSADMVTIEQAICRNSRNGAYQMFLENVTGSIKPGMSAELVLVDRDLLACPSSEIYSTKVLHSVFKGETVYLGQQKEMVS